MIVGLTGGIGAGKSTVASMFAAIGVPIINADEISHDLMHNHSIIKKVTAHFGTEYLTSENTLDRKKLRQRIFESPPDKLWLETLLHPLIKQEIKLRTKKLNSKYCIVEIPLLIEAGMQDCVDRTLTVTSPQELQIQRAMLRDNSSKQAIQAILDSQISDNQRLALSEDIIHNSSDLARLKQQVAAQHQFYLQLAAPKN